jgi:hypothetical protein
MGKLIADRALDLAAQHGIEVERRRPLAQDSDPILAVTCSLAERGLVEAEALACAHRQQVDGYHARLRALMERPLFAGDWLDLTFPPGWLDLIEQLVADLEALPGGETLRCRQLKEKFGTLRLYLDGQGKGLQLIGMAEKVSGETCYVCGAAGTMRRHGWILPLCDYHAGRNYRALLESYKTYYPGGDRK